MRTRDMRGLANFQTLYQGVRDGNARHAATSTKAALRRYTDGPVAGCSMSRVLCEAWDSTVPSPGDFVDSFPVPLNPKERTVTIEIRDASLESRIRKQLQATGSSSVEEVLLRLLATQEEHDRWLLEVRLAREEKPR